MRHPLHALLTCALLLGACAGPEPTPTPAERVPEQSIDGAALRALGRLTLATPEGATRASALVTLEGPDAVAPRLEARAIGADGTAGPWVSLETSWREGALLVAVGELGALASTVELEVSGEVAFLTWAAVVPEPARPLDPIGAARQPLRAEIAALGVTPREDWGARATLCTTRDPDKYRMAIHHTVTAATGDPAANLRGIQAFHMDGREWCDVGYHFLVSLDGRVWEGRPVDFLGAHVGGNNPGNVGVSFMGCFHTTDCASFPPNDPPDAMIEGAARVIAGLTSLYGIPRDAASILGHRDHAGNATACPGDYLYARLDDLRGGGTSPAFAATYVEQSFPLASAPFELAPGEPRAGYLEMRNVGSETWRPGETFLGTTEPRDGPSAIAGPDWVSPTRAASVDREVPPGATGRFVFTVRAPLTPGDYPQFFNLVEEGVAWFGDPTQGGPRDDQIQIRVTTLDVAPFEPPDAGIVTPTDAGVAIDAGASEPIEGGCGCRGAPGRSSAPAALGLLVLSAWGTRRRRGARALGRSSAAPRPGPRR